MAECINGKYNYTCHCKTGYQGNGTHCDAVSEVLESTTSESQTDNSVNTNQHQISDNSTEAPTNSTESTIEDEVTAASLASNDTAKNDTDSGIPSGIREMIYDWREKFYIILAFFLLFTILFLVIIVVLIYKVNKAKTTTTYESVVNLTN